MAEPPSLEALMERYVDGDGRAFDALHAQLRGPLTATLRRWLKRDDLVDDALQVTLMKLHASRHRYQRGAPVLPWVMTIGRNVALDRLRLRASRDQSLEPEQAARIPDPAEPLAHWGEDDEQEVVRAVRAAIEQLPPSSREVVRMHKLEGKAMSEVAEALGIKEGAARVRAHRGYKALAGLLFGFRKARSQAADPGREPG